MAEPNEALKEGEEEKEEKKQGALESIVNEGLNFIKKAAIIGGIAGSLFLVPLPVKINIGMMDLGKVTANKIQDKPALDGILKQTAIGAGLGYQVSETFKGLNGLESAVAVEYGNTAAKIAKGAAWGLVGQPAVVASYALAEDGTKSYFKNFMERWKKVLKYLTIPSLINVLYLTPYGLPVQVAASAGLSYIFGLTQALKSGKGSIKNLVKSVNPIEYVKTIGSIGYKATKATFDTFKSAYHAVGNVAEGLTSYVSGKAPKSEPSPQPA